MNTARHRHSKGRAQAGFSMIEVLAAVLLVSFGILGLLSLLSRASQASVGSEDTLRAAMLANDMSSMMWAAGSVTGVSAANKTAWQTRVGAPTANGLPGGTGTVNNIDTQRSTITIQWTPNNSSTQRSYTTEVVIP